MNIDNQDMAMMLRHVGRFAGALGEDFPRLLHLLGRAMESLAQRKTLVVPVEDLEALHRALQPERVEAVKVVVDAIMAELDAEEKKP